jgi:hypothetical protein
MSNILIVGSMEHTEEEKAELLLAAFGIHLPQPKEPTN